MIVGVVAGRSTAPKAVLTSDDRPGRGRGNDDKKHAVEIYRRYRLPFVFLFYSILRFSDDFVLPSLGLLFA